jgi:hypothetical protein
MSLRKAPIWPGLRVKNLHGDIMFKILVVCRWASRLNSRSKLCQP